MSVKKRNYMAKNKKDFYSEEKIKRRAKEHNCDGIAIICYILFFNSVAWIVWLIILNYIISK